MKNFLKKFFKKISCFALLVALFSTIIFPLNNSYAALDGGIGRTRTCSTAGVPEGLEFNPVTGGKDVEFVLTNPVCISVIAVSYASVKVAIAAMNSACNSGSAVPRLVPSPLLDVIDVVKAGATAFTTGNPACVAAWTVAQGTLAIGLAAIGTIYEVAKDVYDEAWVCGSEWMAPNPTKYNFSTPFYKQQIKLDIERYIRNNDTTSLSDSNKTYREWYYNGVEIEDEPGDGGEICYDTTKSKVNNQYPRQKYYLKGTETGNFNCKKYLVTPGTNDPLTGSPYTAERITEMRQAYDCCSKRSQEYICIHRGQRNVFCKAGTLCTIDGITFSAKEVDNGRIICAETYSLCPYNFALGGGSEYCDYYRDGTWNTTQGRWIMITPEQVQAGNCSTNSEIRNADCTYNNKAGKCKNYCQYLRHCTKVSTPQFIYRSGLTSPYFSSACLDFAGDSRNKTALGGGFLLGEQRHFSAPIAQCVKETLENVFYNRAGHSSCLDATEYPSSNGTCPSGLYITDGDFTYKKGNKVKEKSFFTIIQDNLQAAVKIVITLSIMFYGMNLLLWKNDIREKKDILVYIVKIAMVLYFATGDAWQNMFFDGVYSVSSEFSRMVFKINVQASEAQRDGCQFGEITLPDGSSISSGITYPAGKEYLALWDTLDCKIMHYLGFGPEVSAANITLLIISAWLTGPIGIYFALSVMFFGILFITTTIRALHIFLSSALSIIIMVFISPIIIPLVLFAKTKNIFDGWLKELISFCLQPMILFAYIAIFITVMDKTMIGSATYIGQAPSKVISCAQFCKNLDGTIEPYVNGQAPACNATGQTIVNPLNDSVACLLNVNDFGTFPGLEIIGITVPILINLFSSNVEERILTILRGTLVMYLLYKFMDEIPSITSNLIGGTKLPGAAPSAVEYFKKMMGVAAGIQKRLARGTGKIAKNSKDTIRKGVESGGNKGKSVDGSPKGGGGSAKDDAVTSSRGGGAADSAASSGDGGGGGGGSNGAADSAASSGSGGGADSAASSGGGGGAADSANASDAGSAADSSEKK